ncbi:MAG: aminotransferase class V-fold PLP-dependent enzyme [bacterium JZ-2024 1]
MLDTESIRKDFPILNRTINGKRLIYLDNAATTQKPRCVLEAVLKFYQESYANIHRGIHTLSEEATQLYEQAHKAVADFIHASSWQEIIFTRNATEAINLVAYSWGLHHLQPGDEVVITLMEHHSNTVPWQFLQKYRNITLHYASVTPEGRLDLDDLKKKITGRTRLVAVTAASNVLGTVNPLEEIGKMAREVGALFLVDAAQALPHLPVDVGKISCDFLAASGHKMLAPSGIGFLYGKRALLEKFEPFLYGGDMISEVTTSGATWNELPWKFEAGTPHIAGGVGLLHAIQYLKNIGMDEIYHHGKELTLYALLKLSEIPDIELYGPRDTYMRIGVISFNIRGIHPHDIADFLDREGIAIRSGHHCAQPLMRHLNIWGANRISFYLYNTKEEIDTLVEALRYIHKLFH